MTISPLTKIIGLASCAFLLCTSVASVAVSSTALPPQDIGKTPPGKTIKGEVIKVDGDFVSVKSHDTGEVVRLHLDKTTEKQNNFMKPTPGENVIAKYSEANNHAMSFFTDDAMSH